MVRSFKEGWIKSSPCLGDREGWDLVFPLLTTENQIRKNKGAVVSAPPHTAFRACSFKRLGMGRLQQEMEKAKASYRTLSLAVVLGRSLTGCAPTHSQTPWGQGFCSGFRAVISQLPCPFGKSERLSWGLGTCRECDPYNCKTKPN